MTALWNSQNPWCRVVILHFFFSPLLMIFQNFCLALLDSNACYSEVKYMEIHFPKDISRVGLALSFLLLFKAKVPPIPNFLLECSYSGIWFNSTHSAPMEMSKFFSNSNNVTCGRCRFFSKWKSSKGNKEERIWHTCNKISVDIHKGKSLPSSIQGSLLQFVDHEVGWSDFISLSGKCNKVGFGWFTGRSVHFSGLKRSIKTSFQDHYMGKLKHV